ncbi:site-specific DNA-methyltransferase [Avibacterium paragallinarum]|uniref:site-specific DNA-methyltransferase n=1 Tax=Avibacterium paragallinarum TaxID=728 RepID=UPI0014514D62|nr:site-specific DNA-methyltransferase [Avibacterium paragallinarum]QJE09583.1 site-specific DNA-methyltransferase [Avibacterium paragallinarum]
MHHLPQLTQKLKEIFQTDRADLDFGIYRILNSRADQINDYLNHKLPQKIRQALSQANQGQMAQWQNELAEAEKQAQALGVEPDASPKVQQLQAQIAQAQQAGSQSEAAIFSHLYTFFSRYYDEGDFISQRRYKGDTYAIPYSGEEVLLHWANKDQYYTKSGENFSNYRFKLADGKEVFFRLIAADTAKDNRKDNDAKRLFALAEPRIIAKQNEDGEYNEEQIETLAQSEDGNTLEIRFEYRPTEKKDKQEQANARTIEALKSLISTDWQAVWEKAPTANNPNRTLLEKHLSDYTQKNSADYFIHKDLGGFLRRELDFYIKNEVMHLDNIQHADSFVQIENSLRQIQVLREIAHDLIDFLAQLENFQKKLWLKKKFVAQSHYLITLDRIPTEMLAETLSNPAQQNAWKNLFNFNALEYSGGNLAEQNLEKFQQNQPHLVVDTSLYPPSYQQKLLTLLSEKWDLDANTDGVLIHSDNFQALNLLQARYREQVKCIYIDPPYNTGTDGFIYKDNYQHSSWLTTMENRLQAAYPLLRQDGVNFISIDDNEQARLKQLCDGIYGEGNFVNQVSVKTKVAGVSGSHLGGSLQNNVEYLFLYAKNKNDFSIINLPKKQQELNAFIENMKSIGKSWKYTTVLKRIDAGKYIKSLVTSDGDEIKVYEHSDYEFCSVSKVASDEFNGDQSKVYYEYIDKILRTTNAQSSIRTKVMNETGELGDLISIEYIPKKGKNAGKTIRLFYKDRVRNLIAFLEDVVVKNKGVIYKLDNKGNLWDDLNYNNLSSEALGISFSNGQKPIQMLKDVVRMLDDDTIILDYFSGSGTTAHAVIELNREDGGKRKYILVEQGEYFNEVLKSRIQKAIANVDAKKSSGSLNGVSQIVKVLKLESYEDTLNNLELKGQADFIGGLPESVQEDYLLRYLLDVESKGSLLNSDDFTHPFDYCLNIATDSAGAYAKTKIDLVETFNYLLGLRVQHITDEREKRGYVMVEGALPNGDRCLIVWRDVEKMGYAEVAQCFNAQNINPNSDQYDVVYLNGDHDMASLWQNEDGTESRLSLRAIEPEFLRLMFAQKGE